MAYVDCFVAAVPDANKQAYRTHARQAAAVFRDYGATQVVECWGDDIPPGEVTSFPMAVQCQADETVVVGWVWWPSKAVRDAAWDKVRSDPRMQFEANPMPFDGRRLIYGGFEAIVDA